MMAPLPRLIFKEVPIPIPMKTKVWSVWNASTSVALGRIGWYPHWRRYVFNPASDTLYDASCLKEVVEFIEAEMAKRPKKEKLTHG